MHGLARSETTTNAYFNMYRLSVKSDLGRPVQFKLHLWLIFIVYELKKILKKKENRRKSGKMGGNIIIKTSFFGGNW